MSARLRRRQHRGRLLDELEEDVGQPVFARLGPQLGHGTFGDEAPVMQQADAAAHAFGLIQVVCGQQDGLTGVALAADEVQDDAY